MRLVEALNIVRTVPSDAQKSVKVYLAVGFSPLHLTSFLAAELCLVKNRKIEVETGYYGDLYGNLDRVPIDGVEAVVVQVEWADLDARLGLRSLGDWSPAAFCDILAGVRGRANQLVDRVQAIARRVPVVISFPTLPFPPISFTIPSQAGQFELHVRCSVTETAVRLAELVNVRVLNSYHLDKLAPLDWRFDAASELRSGFPYKVRYTSILANALSRLVWPPPTKKAIITDLDDTLWRGILGEVGVEGVSWDLENGSHMHGAYQQMLHALSRSGVLIGVATKNDPAIVERLFSNRTPVLPRSAIFPLQSGWGAKSNAVQNILDVWNIGADGVVFIDDSPLELAEVAARYPEIECIQFPTANEEAIQSLLWRLREQFGKQLLGQEDMVRAESIRSAQQLRNDLAESGGTSEQFLEQADAELTINFHSSPLDPRALELVNKTNQFNLNGRRHTEGSWRKLVFDIHGFLLIVSYGDKYGPLGKIAVIAGLHTGEKLYVDTWVMSCRAFSRRIEHKCLELLFETYSVNVIDLAFHPTERNGPAKEFLATFLEAEPNRPCTITREQFVRNCPKTFQRVTVGDGKATAHA